MDISPEILKAANELVSERDLGQKDAKLILNKGLDFAEVHGTAFDFIIAQSVLTHMPLEDVKELFSNAHKIMKVKSVFFATFHDGNDKYYTPDYQNFFYPFPFLRSIGAENGLEITIMDDYDHPRNHRMLKITTTVDN
jgi:predicted TPR repeat methyltransferase